MNLDSSYDLWAENNQVTKMRVEYIEVPFKVGAR